MRQRVKLSGKMVCLLVLLLVPMLLAAGDRAEFINLGFSDDGSIFLYGQYGKDAEGRYLYADIIAHSIDEDRRVDELTISRQYPIRQFSGQSGVNALLMSLREHASSHALPINYTNTGSVLFFQLPGQDAGELVTFTDYADMTLYTVSLTIRPKEREPGTNATIQLTLFRELRNGTKSRFSTGSLLEPLEGVYEFHIKQVVLSPDRTKIVIVIQTRVFNEEDGDEDYRYTVYAMPLDKQ